MIVVPQVLVSARGVLFGEGDPLEVARTLVSQGALALQLRDVDRSISDAPDNASEWLRRLVDTIGVPVQFDGGLADSKALEVLAGIGFETVVVGPHAVFDPLYLRWAMDLLGRRLVVEVQTDGDHLYDAPKGMFHVELVEAVRQLRFQGVRHILLRDVTGLELPLNRLRTICHDIGIRVTFSGPIRSLDDIRELAVVGSEDLVAVVVGEPVYDGRVRLADANRIAAGS